MSVNDSKPWWQSSTIWAGVGAIIASVAGLAFDHPASGTDMVDAGVAVQQIVTGVLGLVAIYGRLRATKRIG